MRTRTEFYKERDRRSREVGLIDDLLERTVEIRADRESLLTERGQLLLLLLVNLVTRLHRRCRVRIPKRVPILSARAVPCQVGQNARDLRELVHEIALGIDPYIDLEAGGESPVAASVGIGKPEGRVDFYVGSMSNLALVSRTPTAIDRREGYSMGAALAACLGAWCLFRVVDNKKPHCRVVSAWDLSEGPGATLGPTHVPALDVGRVLQVGAGAVGSGLCLLMRANGVVGEWTVVDGDRARLHNTNRSIGMISSDTEWGASGPRPKAELAAQQIGGKALTCWYDELASEDTRCDLILPLANERGVRERIGQRGEPISLHATTSRSFESQLHRHIPGVDDCPLCRIPSRTGTVILPCSTVSLGQGPSSSDDAALPFLSATSAVMLQSALHRLVTGEIGSGRANFWRAVFRSESQLIYSGKSKCSITCPGPLSDAARLAINTTSRWKQLDPVHRTSAATRDRPHSSVDSEGRMTQS